MFNNVVVPLDGSDLAECALPYVKNMIREGSVGEVTLLRVVNVDFRMGMPGNLDINAIRENMFTESGKYLADVKSRLASEGITVKTETLEGNRPADVISDYVREHGVDMIVIGTHGYTGLKKLMLGSVALGVLHESHVPVLLIRPESCKAK
jgi:nucleotide-binding universal stress UspA family protein